MQQKDYNNLISHYIPNERKYHFVFPLKILSEYYGVDNLDTLVDDNLIFVILEPILNKEIEYNFELLWRQEKQEEQYLDICVSVNEDKFDSKFVIENLKKHKLINGLELYKEVYGKLNKIY